jgi:hypothetical protein
MSQFGLALFQPVELFISDISSTFWPFLGVDEQSVHFEVNCHRGCSVTVDQKYSGRSVVVQMSLGRSVGGRSIKVPAKRWAVKGLPRLWPEGRTSTCFSCPAIGRWPDPPPA